MTDQNNHSQRSKLILDNRIAGELGMDRKGVSMITRMFLDYAREALVDESVLSLPRFGSFEVRETSVKRFREVGGYVESELRVSFTRSPVLKKELEKKHGKARR